jgi:hypothetical protein
LPILNTWSEFFSKTFRGISEHFTGIPKGFDWDRLMELQDKINDLWTNEEATWNEFQKACGEYRMFWWKYKGDEETYA